MSLLSLKPLRKPRANQISTSIFFHSPKLDRHVLCESNLEWDTAIILDHDPFVFDYCEQSVELQWSKSTWTPDFVAIVENQDEYHILILEVKYLQELLTNKDHYIQKYNETQEWIKQNFNQLARQITSLPVSSIDLIIATDQSLQQSFRVRNCRKLIHTAVTDISTEDFVDYHNDAHVKEHFYNKSLEIRSNENLLEINLAPEEMFSALKSWTAGIAEAGVNAFLIQDEIDKNLDFLYPISQFLMRFMVKVDRDFLQEYIAKIERECMFEGTRHESSFLANIIPIFEMIWVNYMKNDTINSENKEIIKTFITMDISGKAFKGSSKYLILRIIVEPNYFNFYLNQINENNTETIINKKIEKMIASFKSLTETIWIKNFNFDIPSNGEINLNEIERKIILEINAFNPPIEFYENNPEFLYILGYIDVKILANTLLKIERLSNFENLERIFTQIFVNFINTNQTFEFEEFYHKMVKNLVLAFSKLYLIPDLLLKNNNFIEYFLIDNPELIKNIIKTCKKTKYYETSNELFFLFIEKIFQRFEDIKQDQEEGGTIYVNNSRERDDFFIENVTTRYGENIYDIFTNIDPIKLITNFSEYLVLITEFKPEAILYFVDNISKSSMFKSNPKKCIQNLAVTFLNYLSKEIKNWQWFNDFKNLPSLVTNGEKNLMKSILDLNNDLDIKNLNQSTIYLLISIYPEYSSKLLKNLRMRCIKNDKLNKNEMIEGILPYIETITNIIIDALRDNEITYKYVEYQNFEFFNEADFNLIKNILSIDKNIRFLDILATVDKNIISKYLTKINAEYSKNKKILLLNDLIQIILENDTQYYILNDYGWEDRHEIYLKEIFKINPPIKLFQKSNESSKLLNSIHADGYKKRLKSLR